MAGLVAGRVTAQTVCHNGYPGAFLPPIVILIIGSAMANVT
jgi:hypothetical protein